MLEMTGLLLAIVDFAGWAPTLERYLGFLKQKLFRFMDALVPRNPDDPDQLRGFNKRTERLVTRTFIATVAGLALMFLYYAETSVPHAPYPTATLGDKILLVVGFLLGLAFACVVVVFFLFLAFNFFIWLVIAPLTFVLHVMSIPRRGILGTVGLLIAIGGVVEKHL